jgi:hypothetical protein
VTESFKAAMVGPTGVGKTTLLTAVLTETEGILDGLPMKVATDEETEIRVDQHRRQLAKALAAQEFHPGALSNTFEMSVYEVSLQALDVESMEIPFSLLDFPGGWMDPAYRKHSPGAAAGWTRCLGHIRDSVMLLVPIDAAVVMEVRTGPQRAARTERLGLVNVEKTAREWARMRNDKPHEPAVLVLAPLKCEKYFDDNGGANGFDGSQLRRDVRALYGSVVDEVRKQATATTIRVMYAPIDTYGCVELAEAFWKPDDQGELELEAFYRFRGDPPEIRVKAAATIMQELCRMIIRAKDAAERELAGPLLGRLSELRGRKDQRKGFLGTLVYHFSGEAQRVAGEIEDVQIDVGLMAKRREQLQDAIARLAGKPNDPRVEEW